MELEEMKTLWTEMSAQMEKQKIVTDSIIIKMTQLNYTSKLNKIRIPEIIGSLMCFVFFGYILFRFYMLNTWYLQVCGMAAAIIIFVLPVLSLRAIVTMGAVNIAVNNYKESLILYSKGKKQFVFAQKMGFYLGAILLVVILPVFTAEMAGKDLFKQVHLSYWYCIVFPFFYAFARWVYKKYMRIMGDAEDILKELEV